MLRATRVEHAGHWPRETARGTVTLAYEYRHRRRLWLAIDAGEAFLLDLPQACLLAEGDGLALSDGTWLAVRAAPEALIEVTAANAASLLRLAWHIGNRHLPAQLDGERILIAEDPIIALMLQGLGARLRRVTQPFSPEGGAYAQHDH
jgi:urease accessory protein